MSKRLVIFGSGEIATLARFYFENDTEYEVVAFTVNDEFVDHEILQGLPLVPFSEVPHLYPPENTDMHVAISYKRMNRIRQQKFEEAKQEGYKLVSYICSRSVIWPDLDVGDNCFILENQTIQPTVRIGNNVVIWSGNHIGHGSVINDHTHIAFHVCISGNCSIGERCFFGVNSTVRDFVKIGDDVTIAMHSSVSSNVRDGSVILGSKGEVLSSDDRRARAIKRKYFGVDDVQP